MEIDQDAMDVTSCNGISNGNQSDVSTHKTKIPPLSPPKITTRG